MDRMKLQLVSSKLDNPVVSLEERRRQKNAELRQRTKTLDQRVFELEECNQQLVSQNVDLSREVERVAGHLMTLLRCLKQERELQQAKQEMRPIGNATSADSLDSLSPKVTVPEQV